MKIGKLSEAELSELIFPNLGFLDESVLLKPALGIDSGIIRLGDNIIVTSTDPITASSHLIGRWVVYVTTNDVLASGGIPRWFLLNLLLPPSTTKQEIKEIMEDVSDTLKKMRISLVAGHTERTPGLKMPIAIGAAIGIAKKVFNPERVNVGDCIYVLGEIALEGAYIIYKEKEAELEELFTLEEKREIEGFPDRITVYPYAKKLLEECEEEILWMHDPTEGGIYNGLLEVALATRKIVEANLSDIPVNNLAMRICDRYGLNPYKLLSSGSLLVIVNKNFSKSFVKKCRKGGLKPIKIGSIVGNHEKGMVKLKGKVQYDFTNPEVDEVWKIFD